MSRFPGTARWFDPAGKCCWCPKPAAGVLMSNRNERIGPACKRCAEAAIKAARAEGRAP